MMLFLPVWWKWLHRKRRKELLEIMSEQNRQEEAARNDRQRLEQQAVESRQLSERALAEERQRQEIRRMQNRGAKERAEEVKAAFLEAAKQIPADQRQEILDRMGQQKEIPTMGRLQYYQAEAEARRQLDTALKQEAQTRERNRTHDRDRGI